ncbi:MAG: hypothetical protein KAZ18_03240 [Acinetobacter sp.]|nr:hypothetical protein [Acinetobacter sp.]
MAQASIWVACLMVPLCVTACSKKDNHVYIPDEAEALSERVQTQSNPVPVLVTAEQLQPLAPTDEVDDGALESFHQQLTNKEQQADWQALRQQLKLKPDQILWLGSQRRRFNEDFNLADLRKADAYPYANQLMIHYFRRLKHPISIDAQGELETTAAYQQRLAAAQQKHQQLTGKLKVDLSHLELALNATHVPVCFNAEDQDAYNAIEYDADQEMLSLRSSVPYVTEKAVLAQAYNPNFDGQQVEVLKVQLHYPLEQAKTHLADLKRGTCLGYLLQLDAGQRLTVKQLILSAYSSDTAIPQPVVYRFQPQQFGYDLYQEQQEVTRRDDGTSDYHPKPRQLLRSTDIPIPQQIDYRFGLANTPVETQGASDE